ncbi:MAG: hypothetical protein A2V90_01450 [Gammaproteobacteria bacterium RBG_16_57_12]|nr:MAG: hypothetical protein A2V90_01450 [Gammaproteobacteria bacterium RBG_16_57_12]
MPKPRQSVSEDRRILGIALGGGAARGWAHIGVLKELAAIGIEPDIVCGTSMGAMIGAAYVAGNLDPLESFARSLNKMDFLRNLDIKLLLGGGFIEGKRMMELVNEYLTEARIENLPKPFAAVATELLTGHELWLREGPVTEAIRASAALPGIFTPVQVDGQWLVDGGLVNPVPISLCRAMGANFVIAVNVNEGMLGRHFRQNVKYQEQWDKNGVEATLLDKISSELKQRAGAYLPYLFEPGSHPPGLFDVLTGSLAIMQDRITRSRMAGDPPEVLIRPRVGNIGLLEFERAGEAIEVGRDSVRRMQPHLQELLGSISPP